MTLETAQYIPWFPAAAAALCGVCCMKKALRPLASWLCTLAILAGFVVAFLVREQVPQGGAVVPCFTWIHIGDFHVDFSYYFDHLTLVMLFVVCGIGTLVSWYAASYMAGDRGYARFFAGVGLFIFAMTNLVMADNLVLLYLGWEGVGLCSYLLIGYYYDKPSAVAAAKKAFIVNRIGDLGFALGIFLTYRTFNTVSLSDLTHLAGGLGLDAAPAACRWIPFLLMLGAFGKSAQLPLYVWLPDAMEGPTPVSALIHAATMVTAGVYMIARLLPLFALSPAALPVVATVGGLTALYAATIALCQYDIKRIYAYSTISQLGYMFLGVGALSTVGGIFHLFTHAFFKALLFLTAGSVMHALAGQLDLRKMSGLARKMPVTATLMFIGCLALAGFPFTAGFYSKDMILTAVMERGLAGETLFLTLAIVGLVTAFLTSFYTFRLWFRVFLGPMKYEMGEEHHATEETSGHEPQGSGSQSSHSAPQAPDSKYGSPPITVEHHHDAHEMPLWMNLPLIVLAMGALFAGYFGEGWMEHMIEHSTAATTALVIHGSESAGHMVLTDSVGNIVVEHTLAPAHSVPLLLGYELPAVMMFTSGVISILGILLAAYFHWLNRAAADAAAARYKDIVRLLVHKYYVDEINDAGIVRPLHLLGEIFFAFDRLVIDGLVTLVGFVPRALGLSIQPAQRGKLQGYGVGMAFGAAVIVLLVALALR